MRRLAPAAVVIAGCSMSSISTEQVATFGYRNAPAVALAASGPADLADTWRAGAHRAVGLTDLAFATDAELCEVARAQGLGEVAVATLDTKAEPHHDCDCSTSECDCTAPSLVMSTSAVAKVRVLDAGTCQLRREVAVETEPVLIEVAIDEAARRRELLGKLALDAERVTREMFVRGPQVVRQQGREVEIEHDDIVTSGDVYYVVRKQEEGKRVVVERAGNGRATLVADEELAAVVVGDELHRKTIDHRLTAFPTVSGGRIEGGHGIGGVGVTVRWSSNQLPLLVEAALNGELIPAFDSERVTGGVGAGLRWPLGPVNPVVVAEAGLSHATQRDAVSDGGYVGLGAGIELWLGKLCLFGDLRYRWQIAEDWNIADEPAVVAHPTTDYSLTVVQVGVAWRR